MVSSSYCGTGCYLDVGQEIVVNSNFSGYDIQMGDKGFIIKRDNNVDCYWCRIYRTRQDIKIARCYLEVCSRGGSYSSSYGIECGDTINKTSSSEPIKQTKTIKMKLNNMMKRLLDSETKTLIKGGLIDGDLLLTDRGRGILWAIMFEANKIELVKAAEEEITEEKEIKN